LLVVPVLLINADKKAVPAIRTTRRRISLFPAYLNSCWLNQAVTPVLDNPSATTKRAAIIITVALEKPERASSTESTPVNAKARSERAATMSERGRPRMKKKIVTNRMANVIITAWNKDIEVGLFLSKVSQR
jgi:hypothetical protein